MTKQELQEKIADVESMIEDRYQAAMRAYLQYRCECIKQKKVVMKSEPQRSQFENHAAVSIDRLKKEYAMQFTPADVGDVIESEQRSISRTGKVSEKRYLMRIERIEVAAFEDPTLAFYGTYLKTDLTPMEKQSFKPILQPDVTRVVKTTAGK